MPDKHNENKFMAMLERRGIVRKTGSEDEASDIGLRSAWIRPEAEELPQTNHEAEPTPEDAFFAREPIPEIPEYQTAQPQANEQSGQDPLADDFEAFVNSAFRSEPSAPETASPEPAEVYPDRDVYADREVYTDRFLAMREIYDMLSIKEKGTDTIYLIEEYLKTLPSSLPDDSRRDIVTKLITASGFDFSQLLGDGVERVKRLKEYAEQFALHTDEYISKRKEELEELELAIEKTRGKIETRRELHKKQFYEIEAEAQRLKDILAFITG